MVCCIQLNVIVGLFADAGTPTASPVPRVSINSTLNTTLSSGDNITLSSGDNGPVLICHGTGNPSPQVCVYLCMCMWWCVVFVNTENVCKIKKPKTQGCGTQVW